jgi:Putative zinc- or iron-chelating domain
MLTHDRSITLYNSRPSVQIQPKDVYFTFASGRLNYDCVTCNAKCCRGFGYLVTRPEMQRQLELRPSLPLFVDRSGQHEGAPYHIGNCAPSCFFLTEAGRCEIHSRLGYAAKPETCRLFPFNNLRRVGGYLVVGPHQSLCPLEVVPSGMTSRCSDHDALLDAMMEQGINAQVPLCDAATDDVSQLITFERSIVTLAEKFLDRSDYIAFTREQLRLDGPVALTQVDPEVPSVESVLQFGRELLDLPGTGTLGRDADLVSTMVAMTPFLRARFVFPDASSVEQGSHPAFDHTRVATAVLWLYLFAEAARAGGMPKVSFQTISQLANNFDSLARLLAWSDAVMTWQRGAPINLGDFAQSEFRMALVRLAKALLPQVQRRRHARLGDLLHDLAPADKLTRTLFIKEVAKHVAGKVVRLDAESTVRYAAGLRSRVTGALRRWVLANAPDTVLEAACDRASRMHT